jgi:hypothetical protein
MEKWKKKKKRNRKKFRKLGEFLGKLGERISRGFPGFFRASA